MLKRIVSILALPMLFAGQATAAESSSDVPYPVTGSSAKAIYEDIKAHAPRVAANATFAFTAIATKTVKSHAVGADGCRYKRFQTSAIYNFYLPQHKNAAALRKPLAGDWAAFTRYLKTHEEGHRDFWRACFAEYDLAALELLAKDCDALDKKRERLFTSVKKRCLGKDEAFDVQFRKDVVKHPFMKAALKPAGDTSRKN